MQKQMTNCNIKTKSDELKYNNYGYPAIKGVEGGGKSRKNMSLLNYVEKWRSKQI